MKNTSSARRGFTLIELLVVIAIISILSTLMFALFKAAKNGNNKGKARGEIQALAMACEVYKKTYGDYPCGSSSATPSNSTQFRKDFFDQLIGRKRLLISAIAAGGTSVTLINYNDNSLGPQASSRVMKPIISLGSVPSNDDKLLSADASKLDAYEFRDPWGNAYDYRYRIVSATAISSTGFMNAPYGDWTAPGFLIVSCGINYVEPATAETSPGFSDYWDSATKTPKTGQVSSDYFQDDNAGSTYFRADNIVNWTTN